MQEYLTNSLTDGNEDFKYVIDPRFIDLEDLTFEPGKIIDFSELDIHSPEQQTRPPLSHYVMPPHIKWYEEIKQ